MLKTLADFGIAVGSEGFEEISASVMTRLGSALYKEENLKELLFSEEAFDEYLESFIGGMVLSGGSNAGKAYNSIKTGTDYYTGLNINEEKLLKSIYDGEIKKTESDGKKLSKEEKIRIYADAMESVKQGEDYDSYKAKKEIEHEKIAENSKRYESKIVANSIEDLKLLGEDVNDVNRLAPTVSKAILGKKLTLQERVALSKSENAKRVIKEISSNVSKRILNNLTKNSKEASSQGEYASFFDEHFEKSTSKINPDEVISGMCRK